MPLSDASTEEDILTVSLGSEEEGQPSESALPAKAVDILTISLGSEEEDQRPGPALP